MPEWPSLCTWAGPVAGNSVSWGLKDWELGVLRVLDLLSCAGICSLSGASPLAAETIHISRPFCKTLSERRAYKVELLLLVLLLHLPLHLSVNQMHHESVHWILDRHTLPSAGGMLHFPDLTRSGNDPGRQLQVLPTFHHERRTPKAILLTLGRAVQERLGSITAVVDGLVHLPHIESRDFCEAEVCQELMLALEAGVGVVDVADADEVDFSRVAGRGE